MTCPHRKSCELLKLLKLKASLRFWTQKYCDATKGFHNCARFVKLDKGEPVVSTLLPSGDDLSKPAATEEAN